MAKKKNWRSPVRMKQLLDSKQQTALRNAERLNPKDARERWKQQLYKKNPATNVDDLVCCLNKLAEE